MSNRNFDASQITQRLRDKNIAQQMYGSFINGKSLGNPQTINSQTSIVTTEYYPGAQTTAEQSLQGSYTFDLGGIANYLTDPSVGPTATVPNAPTIDSITTTTSQITINIIPPISDGGSVLLNYKYSLDNGISWIVLDPPSIANSITVTGLINGTEYQVKIIAVNAIGDSLSSDMVSVIVGTLTITEFKTVGITNWTVPAGTVSIDYLIVGGGGASGYLANFSNAGSGGGGGGYVVTGTYSSIPGELIQINVGRGGNGALLFDPAESGATSYFRGIQAMGGRGGYRNNNGNGLNGGGGSISSGGNGGVASLIGGGGGGGSSGNGSNSTGQTGGTGGSGTFSSITNALVEYGKGGKGGNGFIINNPTNGLANTGNGANGGGKTTSFSQVNGANGGSGIVILRYYM